MYEKLTSSRQLTTTLDVYKVGNMDFIKKNGLGIAFCTAIAFPAWFLGKAAPVIGGPIIAILCGMLVTVFWKSKGAFDNGIKFVSKKVLLIRKGCFLLKEIMDSFNVADLVIKRLMKTME